MSLAIDSISEYLRIRLGINPAKMQEYGDKSIKEILEAEAAQGNQAAIQMAADMFTDKSQLVQLFQLADPNNKLIILNTMTTSQIEKFLPLLETKDLIQGLRYFTMDALMILLQKIPKEELVKTVFQLFSEHQIIEKMPEEQLDKVLTGIDTDKELLLKNLKSLPEMFLAQILEGVTGEQAQGNSAELALKIGQLGDLAYKNAILSLEPEQKRQLTLAITSTDNKYYNNFDADAYTHIINRDREKDDVVKAMGVIRPEYLEKMMIHLPPDLLAVVATQVDAEKFADMLITKFPETLAKLIAD